MQAPIRRRIGSYRHCIQSSNELQLERCNNLNILMTRNHKDLIVWQKARRLAVTLYQATSKFPSVEQFGLIAQSRRAGISVLSNISEGAARGTDKEFRHFLYVARGSMAELEAQLLVARDLGYLSDGETLLAEISEVGRLINGLISATNRRASSLANP
jgi:four helix bundle protein